MNHLAAKELCSIARELVAGQQVLGGILEPPPAMVHAVFQWIVAVVSADYAMQCQYYIDGFDREIAKIDKRLKGTTSERERVILQNKRQENVTSKEKYERDLAKCVNLAANEGIKPRRLTKTSRTFYADLSGWKYERLLDRATVLGRQQADDFFGKFTVTLKKSANDYGTGSGYWNPFQSLILLNTGTEILGNLKHELAHWAQSYMSTALRAEGFGKPSDNISTPDIRQNIGRKDKETIRKLRDRGIEPEAFHSLDDIEFYTDLLSAVETFEWWHGERKEQHSLREDFQLFIDDSEEVCTFFTDLKAVPEKWRKAVKEFAKAIGL